MPQLEQFDTYLSQLVWLMLSFGALWFFLRQVVLPRIGEVLEERDLRIKGDLERAEELRAEAEGVREVYEASLAESRAQARQVVREAAEAAAASAAKRQAEVGQRITGEIQAAEDRIAAARREAIDNIRDVASELAGDAAARLIGVEVDAAAARAAVDGAAKEQG